MIRRTATAAAALAVVGALAAPVGSASANGESAPTTLPPSGIPPTELNGQFGTAIPMKDAAVIIRHSYGYRYMAGQQDSDLTVTHIRGARRDKLRFVDTGTRELRDFPRSCRERAAQRGIHAVCRIPGRYDESNPMFLEIWPRLGDDVIDGSDLPASIRFWVLADAGNDVVRAGRGDDFVNAAQGNDKVWAGPGNDWVRGGLDRDELWGGDGADKIVAQDGNDTVDGGAGNDQLYGATGSDTLRSGPGQDRVVCGGGVDRAFAKSTDKVVYCESVTRVTP